MKSASLLILVLSLSNTMLAVQHDTCILHVYEGGVLMKYQSLRDGLIRKNFKLTTVKSTDELKSNQLYADSEIVRGRMKKRENDPSFTGCAVSIKIVQTISEKASKLALLHENQKSQKKGIGKKTGEIPCDKAFEKIVKALPECEIVH